MADSQELLPMAALMTRPTQGCNVQPVDPCVTKMVMVLPCVLAAIRAWERFNRSKPPTLHCMTYRVRRTLLSLKRRRGKQTLAANDNSAAWNAPCSKTVPSATVNVEVFLHFPRLAARAAFQAHIVTAGVFFHRKTGALCSYFENTNFRSHRSIISYGV